MESNRQQTRNRIANVNEHTAQVYTFLLTVVGGQAKQVQKATQNYRYTNTYSIFALWIKTHTQVLSLSLYTCTHNEWINTQYHTTLSCCVRSWHKVLQHWLREVW